MNNEIVSKLHLHNFTVTERGIVNKRSERTGRFKKVGQLNEAGVFFFAQNVSPFKNGQNTHKEVLGNNATYIPYVPVINLNESQHDFTFEEYLDTTKERNQLSIHLKPFVKCLDSNIKSNLYDIRGVKNGYLEDATLFPYINYDEKFITAKIVRYNSVTGKRSKEEFSNNWFHAYKPIKKELGLKDRITKKVDCFFGEHLLRYNDKPVVIVESEKTAIFCSLLFEGIVFIATGGLGKLKSLSYEVLENREVYVFPDNGAKEWFKIAKKRNWWCSTLIENEGTKGSDVVDYFDTDLGDKLHVELTRIESGNLHFSSAELNFSLKSKQSKRFCLPSYPKPNLTVYQDNASGRSFKGSNFYIFNHKFDVLSANVDFNKWQEVPTEYINKEGQTKKYIRKIPVDASEFINRLEKCFRIMKHLNPDENHKEIFTGTINHLLEHSNYLFNARHIIKELLPMWDNGVNDISEYYKNRDWRYCSKEHIEEKDFLTLLFNDKKAHKTNVLLGKLHPLLNKFQYIKASDLGLDRRNKNTLVWDMIKDYNTNVLGCNTINQFHKKVELQEYFDFIEETTAILNQNEKSCKKLYTPYKETNIVCTKSCTTFKKPSIQIIYDNTFINKRVIAEFMNFVTDEEFLLDIKTMVKYLLDNPNALHFERIDKRIEVSALNSIEFMREEISRAFESEPKKLDHVPLVEAFDYDLDLSDSVLNIDESEAVQKGNQFLYSWICFHNPDLTETDKLYIDADPMAWILKTGLRVA